MLRVGLMLFYGRKIHFDAHGKNSTGVELESVAPGYCDNSNSTGVELRYCRVS